ARGLVEVGDVVGMMKSSADGDPEEKHGRNDRTAGELNTRDGGDNRKRDVDRHHVTHADVDVALHRGQKYTEREREWHQIRGARAESRRDGIGSYRRQNQQRQRRLHCQRDREVIPPSGIALLPEQPCRVSVLIVLESDVDAIEKLGCWSVIPGEEVRGPDGEARRRCENRGARGALLRKRDHRRDRRALGSNPRDASKHSRGRKKSERRKFRKRGKTATASRDSSACDG